MFEECNKDYESKKMTLLNINLKLKNIQMKSITNRNIAIKKDILNKKNRDKFKITK
jgi:hypothetical protein